MKANLLPKVKALYEAVLELIEENVDVRDVKVSDITGRAGIGKGTAYEYFNNKEEIISSQLMETLNKMEDFSEMIRYLLISMDKEIPKRDCMIQFIQLVTDNGPISKLLQKEIKERTSDICMPQDLVGQIVQAGIRQGNINAQMPFLYMKMVVMSKILVYAIYITCEEAADICDREQMHRLLCEGLLKELHL